MENCNFKHYWFETGTPSFLLKLLQKNDYNIVDFENLRIISDVFSSYEIDNLKVEAILFQTGCLTTKDYDPKSDLYTLSYPNKEVKQSFLKYLFDYFTFVDKAGQPFLSEELRSVVINKDLKKPLKF